MFWLQKRFTMFTLWFVDCVLCLMLKVHSCFTNKCIFIVCQQWDFAGLFDQIAGPLLVIRY